LTRRGAPLVPEVPEYLIGSPLKLFAGGHAVSDHERAGRPQVVVRSHRRPALRRKGRNGGLLRVADLR